MNLDYILLEVKNNFSVHLSCVFFIVNLGKTVSLWSVDNSQLLSVLNSPVLIQIVDSSTRRNSVRSLS